MRQRVLSFFVNHRGSTTYGERFAMLLEGKYSSEEDFADHNSGVDAMIELGFVDPDQLYITGGSYRDRSVDDDAGITLLMTDKLTGNWVGLDQFGRPWGLEHY